jgi:hypothetical protein
MKLVNYILLFFFTFLGLFNQVEAKVVIIENEEIESFSEHSSFEQANETKWLGLLYLQEESFNQGRNLYINFSTESLFQNFSGELCLKSVSKKLESTL